MSTPHTRSKSKPAKTPNPSSSSLKCQRTNPDTSTPMSPEKSSQPKIMSKPILKERICDLALLQRVGVVDLFSALGCEPLLSPPDVIYPSLVREFYSNFSMMKEDMVYSEVQGVPIVFNANLLSRVCGISCSGVCPYTTHAAFMEFPGLQYEEQLKVILGENFIGTSLKPMVHDLTPLALLLFKLFHTNLLPRKSGRDRVTYQDVVLILVFMTKTPCDIASLIIKYMSHCASHESMNLSFPALLTKIFRHFSIISDDDSTEPVSTMFDLSVLSANNIEIIESGVLIFGEGHKSFGSFPESPHYMSDPDQEDSVLLKSLLSKVSENNHLLESLKTQFASIESLASLTSQVSMMRASYEMFNKSVTASLESINAKLEILHVHDKKVSRAIYFEFGVLHEGMVTTAKAWEEEFVKLFYKLGTETKYISQQVSTRSMPWHQKKDWLGDMTLAEITSPLPLPAVPPPEAFGMTRAEYRSYILEWLRKRDGKAPDEGKLDKLFSEYGASPVYHNKGKRKTRESAPVDVDDSD
ncbi:uncharacterized protein LOC141665043 isoform X1 [Apium graveolens]|uniref:uncharacterized protein LOC141665043 isoform X1 n=1 Tax=Apium graveolens TaxID=4045 RepID=UPI003D7B0C69